MIPNPDLIKLVKFKRLDAKALFISKRYASSVYIIGYAIELALKYRICKTLRFPNGFPEDRIEFDIYRNASQAAIWRNTITNIRQIKNHNLNDLLFYSGKQLHIQNNFSSEWSIVEGWSETLRYSVSVIRVTSARNFINAAEIIVAELM